MASVLLCLILSINFTETLLQASVIQAPPLGTASADLMGLDLFAANPSAPSVQPAPPANPAASSRSWVTFDQDDAQPPANPALSSTKLFAETAFPAQPAPKAPLVRGFSTDFVTSASSLFPSTAVQTSVPVFSGDAARRVSGGPVQLWPPGGPTSLAYTSAPVANSRPVAPLAGFPSDKNAAGRHASLRKAPAPAQRYLSSPGATAGAGQQQQQRIAPRNARNPFAQQSRDSILSMSRRPNGAPLVRTGTAPPRPAPRDNELFSDLLNNWKAKEGMS